MSKISMIVNNCFHQDKCIFKLEAELKKMGKRNTNKYFSGNYYRGSLNESKLSIDVFRNVLSHLDRFDYNVINRVMNFSYSTFLDIPTEFIDKYKTDAMKFCGVCQEFTDLGYITFLDY